MKTRGRRIRYCPRSLRGGILAFLALMVAACPVSASQDYGVTAPLPLSSAAFKRMDAAGVDVLRLGIRWSKLEAKPGARLDWRQVDDAVINAADRGIAVIPYLNGAKWLRGPRRDLARLSKLNLDEWKRFVSETMSRYGTRGSIWRRHEMNVATPVAITKWEVGIGRNSGKLTKSQTEVYARLLSIAGDAADKIDRGAEVAATVTAGQGRRSASALVPALIAAGAGDFIDTVVVEPHGIQGSGLNQGIDLVRRSLNRLGLSDTNIVIAPLGWASDMRHSYGRSVGLREQARLLRRSFKTIDRNAGKWDAEAVIWSAWRDGSGYGGCGWCRKSGLLDRAGNAKPSLHAFKRFAADHTEAPAFSPSPAAFYGVAPDGGLTATDIRRMGESGVGVARLVIKWPALQPGGSGPIDWRDLDQLMESLAVQGIEPLPQLLGSPTQVDQLVAEDLPEWRAFVSAVVGRYGTHGDFWSRFREQHPGLTARPPEAWQVWNEQNNSRFWAPEPSPGKYAKLLHVSAAAIRMEDPLAEVMLGGMYGYAAFSATDFLRRLYRIPGAVADFDIVAVHPYAAGNAGIASQLEGVRDKMDLFGDYGADIWITEFGWSSVPIDNQVYAHLSRDEPGQAETLRSAYEMLLANRSRWRLRGGVWYSWRDAQQSVCIFCQYTGLLRNDGSPKPSLGEFAELAGRSAP